MAQHGTVQHVTSWHDMARHDQAQPSMALHVRVWYGMLEDPRLLTRITHLVDVTLSMIHILTTWAMLHLAQPAKVKQTGQRNTIPFLRAMTSNCIWSLFTSHAFSNHFNSGCHFRHALFRYCLCSACLLVPATCFTFAAAYSLHHVHAVVLMKTGSCWNTVICHSHKLTYVMLVCCVVVSLYRNTPLYPCKHYKQCSQHWW